MPDRAPEAARLILCVCQYVDHVPDIRIDADGLLLNFFRAVCLPLIDTGIDCLRILCGHLPEGIFDDDRGVLFIAHHLKLCFCI